MRYHVTLDPSPNAPAMLVELEELPSGALKVLLAGRPVDVDICPVGNQLSVRVDGKVVDLTTEGVPPELGAVASGHRSYVRVESDRMRSAEQAKKSSAISADKAVKSPMPGRVVKVLVSKGDAVTVGQGLVVLEAMKMENEVKARAAGTVVEVHVAPGTTVEGNAKLITLA